MFGRRKAAWLVVGLGNPGPRYNRTRHNVGAMVVEGLATRHDGVSLKRMRHEIRTASISIAGTDVPIAVPTSFMNVSGRPVLRLARKSSVKPEHLIIVHDDLDLAFGSVRLKFSGGTGGHNGVASVCSSLRTKEFIRLRVGIGRPPSGTEPADFVLQKFNPDESKEIPSILELAAHGIEILIADGMDAAQRTLHQNP